jgi:hypothetical protein
MEKDHHVAGAAGRDIEAPLIRRLGESSASSRCVRRLRSSKRIITASATIKGWTIN